MMTAERIYREIEGRVRSGAWPPGTRIPVEQELAATYGCARATANKALTRLAAEGLIERRRKAGSFVAPPKLRTAILQVPDIAALTAAGGDPYRWELRRRALAAAPVEVDAPGAGRWLELTGVHHRGALPFGWEHRWIHLDAVPEAEATDFARESPGGWLLAHVPWTEGRHRIRALPAEGDEASGLGIARGTACLQIERWTWRGGVPVTYVRQLFPGDRYDLVEDFAPRA